MLKYQKVWCFPTHEISENHVLSHWQVLEPSLAKGNRVMVFCNTLSSSRAVDHFLTENQIFTVNYHGEVPAEERLVDRLWLLYITLVHFAGS